MIASKILAFLCMVAAAHAFTTPRQDRFCCITVTNDPTDIVRYCEPTTNAQCTAGGPTMFDAVDITATTNYSSCEAEYDACSIEDYTNSACLTAGGFDSDGDGVSNLCDTCEGGNDFILSTVPTGELTPAACFCAGNSMASTVAFMCNSSQPVDDTHPSCSANCTTNFFSCCTTTGSASPCVAGGLSTNSTTDAAVCGSGTVFYNETQQGAIDACQATGIDVCGICGGTGTECGDCLGVPAGTSVYDECGVCNGDGTSCICLSLGCPVAPAGFTITSVGGLCHKDTLGQCQDGLWNVQTVVLTNQNSASTFAQVRSDLNTQPVAGMDSAQNISYDLANGDMYSLSQDNPFPAGTPADFFGLRANATIFLPFGTYVFQLRVDDGAYLVLDGDEANPIVTSPDARAGPLSTYLSQPITFSISTFHTFELVYQQVNEEAAIDVRYFFNQAMAPDTSDESQATLLTGSDQSLCVVNSTAQSLLACGNSGCTIGSSCRCDDCLCQYAATPVADSTPTFALCVDCQGNPFGTFTYDSCDVCGGNGAECSDCLGNSNGPAVYDACDICNGDASTCLDCAGVANGGMIYDQCDVCGGDNTMCADCNGVPNGGGLYDVCNICNGNGQECLDCAGIPHGAAVYDSCDICQGADNTGTCDCSTHVCPDPVSTNFVLVNPTGACGEINGTCAVLVPGMGSRCVRSALSSADGTLQLEVCTVSAASDTCTTSATPSCNCDQPCACSYVDTSNPMMSYQTSCIHNLTRACSTPCAAVPADLVNQITLSPTEMCASGQLGTYESGNFVINTYPTTATSGYLDDAIAAYHANPPPTPLGPPNTDYNEIVFSNGQSNNFPVQFLDAPNFPNTASQQNYFVMTANATIFFVGGNYKFTIIIDDAAVVYVDGQIVAYRGTQGAATENTGVQMTMMTNFAISEGYHEVDAFYYQVTGPASFAVYACMIAPDDETTTPCEVPLLSDAFHCVLPTPFSQDNTSICTQSQAFLSDASVAGQACGCDVCNCAYTNNAAVQSTVYLPCNDCAGVNNGQQTLDACDVCNVAGATPTSCLDCAGNVNGPSTYDACDVCGGGGTSCIDCKGTANGAAIYDLCDICGGDGVTCLDCTGMANGPSIYDVCDVCGGNGESCLDCNGVANGPLVYDTCGVCGGDSTTCAVCSTRTCASPDQVAPGTTLLNGGNCTEVTGFCSAGVCSRNTSFAAAGVVATTPCSTSTTICSNNQNTCDCDSSCGCQYSDGMSTITVQCEDIAACGRACPDTSMPTSLLGQPVTLTAFDDIRCRSGVIGMCVDNGTGTLQCSLPTVTVTGITPCDTAAEDQCTTAGASCECTQCQCKYIATAEFISAETVFLQCVDCTGTPGGSAVYDVCDMCNGNGLSCLDCQGVPMGTSVYDQCGVCNGDGSSCAICGCDTSNPSSADFTMAVPSGFTASGDYSLTSSGIALNTKTTNTPATVYSNGALVSAGSVGFELDFVAMFNFTVDNSSISTTFGDLDQIVGFADTSGSTSSTYGDFELAYAEFNGNGVLYTFDEQAVMQIFPIPGSAINQGAFNDYKFVVQANCVQFYINGVLVNSIFQSFMNLGGLSFAAVDNFANDVGVTLKNVTLSQCTCPNNCPAIDPSSQFFGTTPRPCTQGDTGMCVVNSWNISTFSLATNPPVRRSLQQAIDDTNAAMPIGSPATSQYLNFWNGYIDSNDPYSTYFQTNGATAFPNQPMPSNYFSITANLTVYYALPALQIFGVIVDDLVQLRLDGNVIASRSVLAYASMVTSGPVPIAISPGYHTFDVFYYQDTLPAELEVEVSDDGGMTYHPLGSDGTSTICQLPATDGTQKVCVQTDIQCSAGNSCTCDQCECQYTLNAGGATTVAYEPCLCGNGVLDYGEFCDGSLLAPGVDGMCCDTTTCQLTPGNPCDGGDLCFTASFCSSSGQCVGTTPFCSMEPPPPQCNHYVCQTIGNAPQCTVTSNGDTTETCQLPLDLCMTNPMCTALGACVGTPTVCDGDCETSVCDPMTGQCILEPDSTPCDEDGLTCAANICLSGECVVNPMASCCDEKSCPVATSDITSQCAPPNGTCSADGVTCVGLSLIASDGTTVQNCTSADGCNEGDQCRCASVCACAGTTSAVCDLPTATPCNKFCPVVDGQTGSSCLNNLIGTCDGDSNCVLTNANATDPMANITCSTTSCGTATSGACQCNGASDPMVNTCFCQKFQSSVLSLNGDTNAGSSNAPVALGFQACVPPVCGNGVVEAPETCDPGVVGTTAECCIGCVLQSPLTSCAEIDRGCGSSFCNATGGCTEVLLNAGTPCPASQQCLTGACTSTGQCIDVGNQNDGNLCTSSNDNTCDTSTCQNGICITVEVAGGTCCPNNACPFGLICGQVTSGVCSGATCTVLGQMCASSVGSGCIDMTTDGAQCMCAECGCVGFNITSEAIEYAPCNLIDPCLGVSCGNCSSCTDGHCMFNSTVSAGCDDGFACTVDACSASTGGCVSTSNDNLCVPTGMCQSDGMCTPTSADAPSGCTFMTTTCAPTTCFPNNMCVKNSGMVSCTAQTDPTSGITCDDNDICTSDSCVDPGGCVFTPISGCGVDTCTGTCPFGSATTTDGCRTGRVGSCANGWLVQEYDLTNTNNTIAALMMLIDEAVTPNYTEYVGKINYGTGVDPTQQQAEALGYFDNDRPYPSAESDPKVTTHFGLFATSLIYLAAGEYEFRVTHDDGAVLVIDDAESPCVSADVFAYNSDSFCRVVFATDGDHDFQLYYTQNTGSASIELAYRQLNTTQQPPESSYPNFHLLGDTLKCNLVFDFLQMLTCSSNVDVDVACTSGDNAGVCLCDECACASNGNSYAICIPQDCTDLVDGTQCDDQVACTLDSACFSGVCTGLAPDDSLCPLADGLCEISRCAVQNNNVYACQTETVPGCTTTSCGQCAPITGFVADTAGCLLSHAGFLVQPDPDNSADLFCSLNSTGGSGSTIQCSLLPATQAGALPGDSCTCDSCTCKYTNMTDTSIIAYNGYCSCANRECVVPAGFPVIAQNCSYRSIANAGLCSGGVCTQNVLTPGTVCGFLPDFSLAQQSCSSSADEQCAGLPDRTPCYCDDCACAVQSTDHSCFAISGAAPCIAISCDGEPNGTPCDDGVACTTSSICENDVCVGLAPSDALCTDDSDPCTVPRCAADNTGTYMCMLELTPGCSTTGTCSGQCLEPIDPTTTTVLPGGCQPNIPAVCETFAGVVMCGYVTTNEGSAPCGTVDVATANCANKAVGATCACTDCGCSYNATYTTRIQHESCACQAPLECPVAYGSTMSQNCLPNRIGVCGADAESCVVQDILSFGGPGTNNLTCTATGLACTPGAPCSCAGCSCLTDDASGTTHAAMCITGYSCIGVPDGTYCDDGVNCTESSVCENQLCVGLAPSDALCPVASAPCKINRCSVESYGYYDCVEEDVYECVVPSVCGEVTCPSTAGATTVSPCYPHTGTCTFGSFECGITSPNGISTVNCGQTCNGTSSGTCQCESCFCTFITGTEHNMKTHLAACELITDCTGVVDGSVCDDQVDCTLSSACFNGVCVGLAPSDEFCSADYSYENTNQPPCSIPRCSADPSTGVYGCVSEPVPGCTPPQTTAPTDCSAICPSLADDITTNHGDCSIFQSAYFEIDFSQLSAGATAAQINAAYAINGVFFSAPKAATDGSGVGELLVFNSTVPSGGDFELGTPNMACCKDDALLSSPPEGNGAGGHPNRTGENCLQQQQCLILSDNGNTANPHAALHGGQIQIDFCSPAYVQSAVFINAQPGTRVQFFDEFGIECAGEFEVPAHGTNAKYVVEDTNGNHQHDADEGLSVKNPAGDENEHAFPPASDRWARAHCDGDAISRLVITTHGPLCLDDLVYGLPALGATQCTDGCLGLCCPSGPSDAATCVTATNCPSTSMFFTGLCDGSDNQMTLDETCSSDTQPACCQPNDRVSTTQPSPMTFGSCYVQSQQPNAVDQATTDCPPLGACCSIDFAFVGSTGGCADGVTEDTCDGYSDAVFFEHHYCRDAEVDQCRLGQCCSLTNGANAIACACSDKTPDANGNCNGEAIDCDTNSPCVCTCFDTEGNPAGSCPCAVADTAGCSCSNQSKKRSLPVEDNGQLAKRQTPASPTCTPNVLKSTCEDGDPYAVFTPYTIDETNDSPTAMTSCIDRQPCLQQCGTTGCYISAFSRSVAGGASVIEYFFLGDGCQDPGSAGLLFGATTVFSDGSTSTTRREDLSCGFIAEFSAGDERSRSTRRHRRNDPEDDYDDNENEYSNDEQNAKANVDKCGVCDDKCTPDTIYVPYDDQYLGVSVYVPAGYSVTLQNVSIVALQAVGCNQACTLTLPAPQKSPPSTVIGCNGGNCKEGTIGSDNGLGIPPTNSPATDKAIDAGTDTPCGITSDTVTAQDPLPLLGALDELRSALIECDPQAFVKNTPIEPPTLPPVNALKCQMTPCGRAYANAPAQGLDVNTQSGLLTLIEIQIAAARSDLAMGDPTDAYQASCCSIYLLQSVIRQDAQCGEVVTENCDVNDFLTPPSRRKRDLLLNEDAALINGGSFTIAFEECDEVDDEFVPDNDNNDLVLTAYATIATSKTSGAWVSTTINVIPIAAGTLHDHALEMRFDDAGIPAGASVHIVRYGVGATQECYTVNSLTAETTECPSVNTLRLIMSTDAALPQKVGVDSPFVNTVASVGVSTARHMTTVHITMPPGYTSKPTLAMAFEMRQRTTQCVVQTHTFASHSKVRGFAVIVPGNYIYPQEGVPTFFNKTVTPTGGICVSGDNAGMRCSEVQECPSGYCIVDDKKNVDNNWHCMNYPAPGVNYKTSCSRQSECPGGRCYGALASERGAYAQLATFLESQGTQSREWTKSRVTQNANQIYYDPTLHGGATAAAFKTAFKKN